MNAKTISIVLAVILVPSSRVRAQTPTSTPNQPAVILNQSLAAMTGATNVSNVTLTGTTERIVGSDDETGTVTYNAVPGANRLDLSLSSGTHTEIRTSGTDVPAGNRIGPDAVVHEIPLHNLFASAGRFPIFTISNALSAPAAVLTYVGTETKSGISVIHVQVSRQYPNVPASIATLWQRLGRMDIYLNASTLLPTAVDFFTHPDNNQLLDIPVEFTFADYRAVGSLTVPFHVQESVNGSLLLDIRFQHASVNSGISSSSSIFTIQ
jgi:hypothetical protein